MHFVDGKPLDDLIDDGDITPKMAASIAKRVANGLAHAHSHGILHRDIKPANILVDKAGEPQITDFGLAKDMDTKSKLTYSGATIGTPQYMPPEQADGRLKDIDERSDVYSLGATLYEMLAYEPPFTGDAVIEVIQKVILADPVSPRRKNPIVDKDLSTICLKCLEKEPERRFASAEALAGDLGSFLAGDPITARPASFRYRMMKKAGRHRALVWTVGIAAVLLLSGAIVAGLALRGSERGKEEAETLLEEHKEVTNVLLAAHAKLGRIHQKMKRRFYDSTITQRQLRDTFEREYAKPLEAFGEDMSSHPSAQATSLAVQGWFFYLGGKSEEAFSLFRRAREADKNVGWAPLLESMVWFFQYLLGRHLPEIFFKDYKLQFGETPEESESMKKARRNFERLIGMTRETRIWGVTLSKTFPDALAGIQQLKEVDPETAVEGLTAALEEPAFSWIAEEILMARAKYRYLTLDIDRGIEDILEFLDRCPESATGHHHHAMLVQGLGFVEWSRDGDPLPFFRKAIEIMARAIEKKPRDAFQLTHRGDIFLELADEECRRLIDSRENYKKAIEDFDRAIQVNPAHITAFIYRGRAYRQWGIEESKRDRDPRDLFRRAIDSFDEAGRLDPEDPRVFHRRGETYYEQGLWGKAWGQNAGEAYEKALADLGSAIEANPGFWEPFHDRSSVYARLAEEKAARREDPLPLLQKALADLDEALRADSSQLAVWTTRANTHLIMAQSERNRGLDPTASLREAIKDSEEAMRRDPKNAPAYRNRAGAHQQFGYLLWLNGRDPTVPFEKAIRDYGEALKRNPDQYRSYHHRSVCRRVLGEFAERLGRDPGDLYQKALEDSHQALKRYPGFANGLNMRGALYLKIAEEEMKHGRDPTIFFDKAMKDIDAALDRDPNLAQAHYHRALAWNLIGEYRESRGQDPSEWLRKSIRAADEALRRDPVDVLSLNIRASSTAALAIRLWRNGEDPSTPAMKAIEDFSQVLQRRPHDPRARANRATAYILLAEGLSLTGRDPAQAYRSAIADFGELLKRYPNRLDVYSRRGNAFQNLASAEASKGLDPTDSYTKAIADLEKALKGNPKHYPAAANLANVYESLGRLEEALKVLEKADRAHGGFHPDLRDRLSRTRILVSAPAWAKELMRGKRKAQRKRWAEAKDAYEKGVDGAARADDETRETFSPYLRKAHFDLACIYSRSSTGESPDPLKDTALRTAVDHLKKALELGYADLDEIRKNPDLAPLRDRPEFKALLAEQEEKLKKEK
jgi:serine/threonine-protein kinase